MKRRLLIIVLALVILALNAALIEPDPTSWAVLGLADAFLATLLVAGWRRVRQDERDRERLEEARRERTWE